MHRITSNLCPITPLESTLRSAQMQPARISLLNSLTLFTLFTFSLFSRTASGSRPTNRDPRLRHESVHRVHRAVSCMRSARSTISNSERGAPLFAVRCSAPNELKRKPTMNRRELFAALAATAVAGDALAFAQNSPGTTPAAAPSADTTPAAPVMGSKVFDWNAMVDKPKAPVRCGRFARRRRRRSRTSRSTSRH